MLNLSTLNPQQRQAVETIRGPVLILAGAGTGKTRVITFRIAHMVGRGIAPGNILGVTFTNKAAREMQERVSQAVAKVQSPGSKSKADKENRPTICTFHSLCVRILRQHIEKLGYKKSFVIYDESEQLAAVKKILSAISAKGEKTDPGAVLAMLSKFKNGGESSKVFGDPSVRALAQHIATRYESALHACNAVDFDDLILLTLRLFREHPDALEACRAKYKYVMVDEYQDTNAAQFELVHALTQEHRNFCVVGDDDQSIYGWRGAEVANLLNMEKHFPEIKVVKLEQNYRSTTTILNAANAIIKNNARRRGKTLWSGKGAGAKILLNTYGNDEDEARETVAQIEFKRLALPRAVVGLRDFVPHQPAVAAAGNRVARGECPLSSHRRAELFDRREIKDFIAFLKTFLNPHDDISLLRIANVPARGLSDVTMERLLGASHDRKCSVFTAMKNPLVTTTFQKNTRESIEAFVEFVERVQGQLQTTANDFRLQTWADNFLNETGYFAELRRLEKNPENSESRVRNLKELMATMDGAGNLPAERLENFLENITLDSDREEEKENTGDAVTLITMHSCKGLEFPHVFVVGLEDGLLPHTRSKVEGTMDEERRLFYVAVTRAMQTLTISHCGGRKKYGQLLPVPSLAVPEGAAGGTRRAFRLQIQDARRAGIRQKSFRRHALGGFVTRRAGDRFRWPSAMVAVRKDFFLVNFFARAY